MVNKSDIIAWIEEMSDGKFEMLKIALTINGYNADFFPLFYGNPLWEKLADEYEFSDDSSEQDFDEDDCDYEVGFDPYLGCFSDDC